MARKLTDQEKIEIVDKYTNDKRTHAELAKEYNVGKTSIGSVLKVRKVAKNPRICKYTLNEYYFDVIDTEEKAYFLGLLFADGSNFESRHCVSIGLQTRDASILTQMNNALESNRPITVVKLSLKNPNHQDSYRLGFVNSHLSVRLAELGCVAQKSLTLQFPKDEHVPAHLLQHFLRGYWDGDGTITGHLRKNRYNYFDMIGSMIGTLDFCNAVVEKILTPLGIHGNIYHDKRTPDTTTRQLTISGNAQVLRFFDWLYKDATVYFERKFNKYQEFTKMYAEKHQSATAV